MLGRSPRLAHRYGSSLKIWQKRTCVEPSKPTGMSALRRSTTYAGKFGRVLNPKEHPTNRPAQDRRFRPNKLPQSKRGGEECPHVQISVRLRGAFRWSPCWLWPLSLSSCSGDEGAEAAVRAENRAVRKPGLPDFGGGPRSRAAYLRPTHWRRWPHQLSPYCRKEPTSRMSCPKRQLPVLHSAIILFFWDAGQ